MFDSIHCPTNGSPRAAHACTHALGIARRLDATLDLVHVLDTSPIDVLDQDDLLIIDGPEAPREITADVAGPEPVASKQFVKNNAFWETVEGTDDPNAEIEAYTNTARFLDE